MRLIDADKLIKSYRKLAALEWNQTVFPKSWADAYESFIDDIEEAPTIQPQGIDKDRLIEFLKEQLRDWEDMKFRYVNGADCGLSAIEDVLEWVNQQPTSDGWIPVSERLPEEDMWCLITYQSGGVEKVKYCTANNWGQNDDHIIAWQPLPPAYKESE